MKHLWMILLSFIFLCQANNKSEKPFVIVIPSYNNAQWCQNNLASVFAQNYTNYRVIYINDCSTDKTYHLVLDCIASHKMNHRVTLINNEQRHGATYNLYHAIHSCRDEEIILTLDGDDWLSHPYVLSFLNEVYQDNNVWLTFGQYQEYPTGHRGFCEDFPSWVVKNNAFRRFQNLPMSHLRTFYAGLFKRIAQKDLCDDDGNFLMMTWDKAMMAPMIEMAGDRYRFINEILYIYNNANPISDHRIDHQLQLSLMHKILAKPSYQRLTNLFN
ncbi:MAG: glycosyltransferase family 2 protein [Candidatus Dependentiae bacterium]